MTDTHQDPELIEIPEAVAEPKRRHSIQLVWLIPIVAAIIGGTLAIKTYLQKGPTITITFKTGEGLEAGKTKIKYKDVEIGVVKDVTIAKDLSHVIVTAELKKETTPYLVEDTRFWVVRPRISGGSVTGLGTLMGGAYIGIDVGKSKQPQRTFKGLDIPPAFTTNDPGSLFQLHSADLGSLDIGSPLYFRRIQVGQVASYELDKDGTGVTFKVFVAAPYDRYVKVEHPVLECQRHRLHPRRQRYEAENGIAGVDPYRRDRVPDPGRRWRSRSNRPQYRVHAVRQPG